MSGLTALTPVNSAPPSPRDNPIEQKSKWKEILYKVWEVAKQVLFGLLGVALFATNPTVFAVGFIIGVVWHGKTRELIDKVALIYKQQTWVMMGITGAAAFLSIHVTWAAAAALYSLHLGAKVSERALALNNGEQPNFRLI